VAVAGVLGARLGPVVIVIVVVAIVVVRRHHRVVIVLLALEHLRAQREIRLSVARRGKGGQVRRTQCQYYKKRRQRPRRLALRLPRARPRGHTLLLRAVLPTFPVSRRTTEFRREY
jgi:hypothetical protein